MKMLMETIRDKDIKESIVAMAAMRFIYHMKKQNNPMCISNYEDDECYEIYVFDNKEKIWEIFNKLYFKKSFLKAIDNIPNMRDPDNKLHFSNGDLDEIYELVKVYLDEIEFDLTNHADNDDLVINVNGEIFNINKREFIKWEPEYVSSCPFLYNFTYDGTCQEVINFFELNNITGDYFEDMIDSSDIMDDINCGFTSFDLEEFIFGFEEAEDEEEDY